MVVLTSDRDDAEVALESRVRELLADGLSEDAIAAELSRAGAGSDRDALWLYASIIARHRRGGVAPRPHLPSLE